MATITFFQTKGGTGKTTAAFLLAEILSRGNSVSVVDADPNHPFEVWKSDGGEGEKFEIITEPDVEKIPEAIYAASTKSAFVIVDTEGSANETAGRAAAMSDLVIVTTAGTPLDQRAAARAIKFVKKTGKRAGRKIPTAVLMTQQPAIGVSRTVKQAINDMKESGITVLDTQIIRRDALAAIFGYTTTLFNLDPKKVNDPFKAYINGKAFALEVAKTLSDLVHTEKDSETNASQKTTNQKQAEVA